MRRDHNLCRRDGSDEARQTCLLRKKPLAYTVRDVRTMAAAHKYNVQSRNSVIRHSTETIRQLCEWVWATRLGRCIPFTWVATRSKNVYCQIPNLGKVDQHYDVPAGLDYDLWIGPEPFRPLHAAAVGFRGIGGGWLPFGCSGATKIGFVTSSIRRSGAEPDVPTSVVAEVV